MEDLSSAPFTPAGVVAGAGDRLDGLNDILWAARSPEELVGTVEELEALRCRLAAVETEVLAEIETRKVARTHLAWGSTSDWFTHLAGTHRGPGHRTVRQAAQLVSELPRTHAGLRAGAVSPEQAAVIADAIDRLPRKPELRERAEALLLDEASRLNATDLARVARHLLAVVDPDKADHDAEKDLDKADRAAHRGRYLSITEDGAGGVRLRGRGTVEDAATLKAALLPLTAPAPAADPDTGEDDADPRDHGARLWDALIAIAGHALTTDLPPESHGSRPRLTITTSLAVLTHGLTCAGVLPTEAGPQDAGQRAAGQEGVGGVDPGSFDRALPVTDDGQELTPGVVRRLACDADVIPVVLGSRSEVLDVGRLHRLVTAALWFALVCRDQHCAFPGCTRPPVMCHAHHIRHWLHGGKTSLPNLVLLCGHHHRVVHHTPWEVRLSADDGRPEFLPPPRRGRAPEWIRNRPRRE
jgi:uncharacterized protein DUF222